jgi:hypothetical protein
VVFAEETKNLTGFCPKGLFFIDKTTLAKSPPPAMFCVLLKHLWQ